ncbi:MAG TPA: ribonuclease III [Candidatus Moranbacteria bacterium]|nr:ribonuclease III [Candidatus Moranbacteria bacterium]
MHLNKAALEAVLKVKIKNEALFLEALTHRSYLNEHRSHPVDQNERMEFLGDAVLELITTEHLFSNYNRPEGELTNWRASLVNGEMLAKISRELGIEQHLLMSRGEQRDTGKARQYLLANTMEALIGALYLDSGYEAAKKFVEENIIVKLPTILKERTYLDAKSYFQERAQEIEQVTPHYEVLKEWGPDHEKRFLIGVFLGEEKIAEGEGDSKQSAQRNAASEALRIKGWQ